ncbi:hypothetical protein SLA2020_328060 [Shorea laevis]
MDADLWSAHLSSASRRYQSALQSRSDMFMGFEEIDGDDDMREEFPYHSVQSTSMLLACVATLMTSILWRQRMGYLSFIISVYKYKEAGV